MFDLKNIERRLDCAREEFEYERERENAGRTEEQIVLYVFFAGCSPQVAHDGDSFDGFRGPENTGLNSVA